MLLSWLFDHGVSLAYLHKCEFVLKMLKMMDAGVMIGDEGSTRRRITAQVKTQFVSSGGEAHD